jgi:hypothetical protein
LRSATPSCTALSIAAFALETICGMNVSFTVSGSPTTGIAAPSMIA